MKNESFEAVNKYIRSAKEEVCGYTDKISADDFKAAAELIAESQKSGGRIHITGIGKPAHIAQYAASLFSSTGNPCYFLHGTEAVHGSCGQLVSSDIVIAISNSGETAELKATVAAIKSNGCKIIGISANPESFLAKESDAFIFAGVDCEGGPLNRAPRNSILAQIIAIDALSVALQVDKEWDAKKYVRCHPGGKLGILRKNEM